MQGEFRANGQGVTLHIEMNWRSLQAFAKAVVATVLTIMALYSTPAFQALLSILGN